MQKPQMSAVDQQKNYKTQLCRHFQKSKYISFHKILLTRFLSFLQMVFVITVLDVVMPMENMSCVNHKIKELKSLTTRIRWLLPKTCTT